MDRTDAPDVMEWSVWLGNALKGKFLKDLGQKFEFFPGCCLIYSVNSIKVDMRALGKIKLPGCKKSRCGSMEKRFS